MEELISNFKFLRVLSWRWRFEVPSSIGDLIHLRSLDLSGTYIERLPDSTCSLYNLQELKLNDCAYLKELPVTLHELSNLRRLELMGTTLTKAPLCLKKLKSLHVWMDKFEVGKSSEFSIQQIGELDLHGALSITNLENIANPCEANLKKTHIEGLSLQWNLEWNNDDSIKEREVFENLQPSRHLKHLSINGYGGTQFPHWLSNNYLSNVVSLTLKNCKHCIWLPSLGLLTFLKHLTIDGLDWIGRIDADFYANSSSAFASLETLSFTDMKEWEEWQCMIGSFPSLQSLSLTNCPKLKGQLPDKLCHLKKLTVNDCGQLEASIPRIIQIQCMNMKPLSFDMTGPPHISDTLEYLVIDSCPGMNIPVNHCYHSLVELNIGHGCDSLTTFPLDLFPKLGKLRLQECRNLQMISQGHPHNHLESLMKDKKNQ